MNQGQITTNSLRISNSIEPELVTDYGLDVLSALLHETAIEKGFWDSPKNFDVLGNKLALVHSEVTEVLEALRKNKGSEEIVEEISDILIRTLDIYASMRNAGFVTHSLDEVLFNKIEKNKVRPRLHGNLF
jgi:NTP pyrophosphatase (non-canonical NTP hydrolase)